MSDDTPDVAAGIDAALENATSDRELVDAVFDNIPGLPKEKDGVQEDIRDETVAQLSDDERDLDDDTPTEKAEEKVEEVETKETEEEQEPEYIDTLEGLAEANEWEIDQLLDLQVKVGEEEQVPLGKLIATHLDTETQRQALAENVQVGRQQHQEFKDFYEKLHQENTVALQILDTMESNLVSMAEDPELLALQNTDKGAYATRMLEINQHTQNLRNQREELTEKYYTSLDEGKQALLQLEGNKLQRQWGEEASTNYEHATLVARNLGFTDKEIGDMIDSRFFIAAKHIYDLEQKIAEYQDKGKAAKAAKDKAKSLRAKSRVKVLRPTGGSTAKAGLKSGNLDSFDEHKSRFMKSGGEDTQAFENALGEIFKIGG